MLRLALVLLTFLPLAAHATGFEAARPDWLKHQPFMAQSDGDLGRDLAEAGQEGQMLMVIWEQAGCIYCAKMHRENFAHPEITELLDKKFRIVQLDMYGPRPVTWLDGREMTEEELGLLWGVNTTPTTIVLSPSMGPLGSAEAAEHLRLPGFLPSFLYLTVLEYYSGQAPDGQDLDSYIDARAAEFRARGIDPELW